VPDAAFEVIELRRYLAPDSLPPAMQAELLHCDVLRLEPAPRSIYGNETLAQTALAT
jgi:hypothetical protein